ncbi:PREDICTED: uncharacterized protein LOC106813826 [Priapulus caudatus]|uniref:Uncharacterized protein LOC106813826 n=1 Tax=Priapulus caudatus TaxID=37621 RepID=A0ABM1EMX1_PRICU|nr:PREDICTED: uncharacterized protein LOC106813826 [Priapulus caudatus]
MQIHHFSDASSTGYGQCSYLRMTNKEGSVHCTLLMGKSRVAPLKTVTIPRLELTAALLSIKVSTFLQRELPLENVENIYWTDSNVVLGYINNDEKRFHVFVANRVCQIRQHSSPSQWRHVRTHENPADEASRGLTVNQIATSKWLSGPSFLWEREFSHTGRREGFVISPTDPEVKRTCVHATSIDQPGFDLKRLDRFSDWYQVKRAVANCLRVKAFLRQICMKKHHIHEAESTGNLNANPMSVEMLRQAEKEIISQVQRKAFADEIKVLERPEDADAESVRERKRYLKKATRLHQLDPFLDSNGIMRVGGRIRRAETSYESRHPAILPQGSHMTDLIIRHCHEQTAHQGRGMTINQLRSSGFWILAGSRIVSRLIRKCVTCCKLRGKIQWQKMSDLPGDRVEPAPPFTYSCMDCFGPFIIKEGRKEMKRYGLLFSCMASRAIHIETLNSLSTDSFINGLRRFLSTRGPVRQLRSDRGTNFVGAETELKGQTRTCNGKIKDFLVKEGCDYTEFKFNVPSASHMGGVWERQIRSIRRVLEALMLQSSQQLDDESLRTFLCEAAAIVSSRPLTVDNLNDPTHAEALTPNDLLTMKSKVLLPPP